MRKDLTMFITVLTLLATLARPIGLAAQDNADGKHRHHHYKLIEPDTFGGPGSRLNGFVYSGSVQDLNNSGTVTGWADTSMQDPYQFSGNEYGNFCFDGDCYVTHAFQWQDGLRTDLGALPGGLSSATSWISANGLIAGASQNGETDPLDPGYPEDRAVLWRNGNIMDLGTLPEGGYESGAEAVNSRGQVVGWAFNKISDPYSMSLWSTLYNYYEPIEPYQTRAFVWQDGVMQDMGTLGTGTDAFAMAINERGQAIGISYTNSTPNQVTTSCSLGPIPTQDPFLWENGKMIDLGTLGGTCGVPSWINNFGHVAGSSDLAQDLAQHAFLWTRGEGMKDLGTLGGSNSEASMVSDSGKVVGGSLLQGDTQYDAFLWNGKMHDLGALNGANCAYAFSVNAQEQVVGNSGPGCSTSAFLWEDGGPMVDLNTLIINPNPALTLLNIDIINDRGEIAGMGGDTNDLTRAVVLIPCDENHPGVEGCDYSLVDASAAVRVSPVPVVPRARTTNRSNPVGQMLRQRLGFARFAEGSQQAALNGKAESGTGTEVELVPNHLSFGCIILFPLERCVCSPPRTTTLTNIGSTTLDISGIAISGPFSQTNTCGKSVAAGSSCNISVTWLRSVGSGAVSVSDNGVGSPQMVSLYAGRKACSP